ALDVPGHRDTRRLDLAVGHVVTLDGLDAEVTEGQAGSALGRTGPLGVVLLAVLDTTRHQHDGQPSFGVSAEVVATAVSPPAGASVAAGASPPRSARVGRSPREPRLGRSPPRPGRPPPAPPRPGTPA